jgi:tRNA (guanine10-N2)-dimethyltransferase
MRPEHHPASINPKLACAAINLSGLREGVIYDPMCGVGGILIEAGLMRLSVFGSDTDEVMLRKAKINLEHYKVEGDLFCADALKTTKKADCIITDLPYSRSTKHIPNLHAFYTEFLKHAQTLAPKAVIMFPDSLPAKKIAEEGGWLIEDTITFYLHKTLSKKILVLKRP